MKWACYSLGHLSVSFKGAVEQPQQNIAGHRRCRIDHAGKNPGNRAEAEQHHQRHHHQCHHHDASLHEVRQADGKKPANHGVGQHYQRREEDARHVRAEPHHRSIDKCAFEQQAPANQTGSGIDSEENDNDNGRRDTQRHGLVPWLAFAYTLYFTGARFRSEYDRFETLIGEVY